jgi:plastocyanin
MTARHCLFAPALRALVSTAALAATATSCGNMPQSAIGAAHMTADARPAPSNAIAASTTASSMSEVKNVVAIGNFSFQPATLTVAAGSKVVWANRDEEPHVVVSAGAQFPSSPALDTDDSYTAVFAMPGTYSYFCSIHPHMVGTIIVK